MLSALLAKKWSLNEPFIDKHLEEGGWSETVLGIHSSTSAIPFLSPSLHRALAPLQGPSFTASPLSFPKIFWVVAL